MEKVSVCELVSRSPPSPYGHQTVSTLSALHHLLSASALSSGVKYIEFFYSTTIQR